MNLDVCVVKAVGGVGERGNGGSAVAVAATGDEFEFEPARTVARTEAAEDGHEGVAKLL